MHWPVPFEHPNFAPLQAFARLKNQNIAIG
jgi:hypothetical protein